MVLPRSGLLGSSGFEFAVLLGDGCRDLLLLVALEPFGLTLLLLLEQDVLLSGDIDVLHQVDASLSLALPLSLTHLVLPIGFLLNKVVNLPLEVVFVTFGLLVILLKLNDLLASRVLLSLL